MTRNDFLVSKKNSKKLTSMSDDSYDSMGTSGTQDSEKTGIGDNDDALFNSESMVAMEAGKQPFEMSLNHSKILILISKYAKAVTTSSGKEGTWIRELPLSVMIYEGIVAGIIDCDYAPKSMVISSEGTIICIIVEFQYIFEKMHPANLKIGDKDNSVILEIMMCRNLLSKIYQLLSGGQYHPGDPC